MADEEPDQNASEEPKSSTSEQPSGKPGEFRAVIIGALFTLMGGLIGVLGKGCYDLKIEADKSASELKIEEKKIDADLKLESEKSEGSRKLERQKLDADLVKLALQGSEDSRRESLKFMVETNLIADPDIRKGVNEYLESKKPVPSLSSSAKTASPEFVDVESPDKRVRAHGQIGRDKITLVDGKSNITIGEIILPLWLVDLCFSPSGDKLVAVGGLVGYPTAFSVHC
jgi:hypothetical protein